MDTQLKKGALELCMLACIAKEEQYGYDIIRKMQQHFPEMQESAFYAILRRLYREGVLEQFPGTRSDGPPRKYYRVTPAGLERLEHQAHDWKALTAILHGFGID